MALPFSSLADLQMLASTEARQDKNGNEMLSDALRAFCAQAILHFEKSESVRVPSSLTRDFAKYNKAMKAEAKAKANAEAEAKAKAETEAEDLDIPSQAEITSDNKGLLEQVSVLVCGLQLINPCNFRQFTSDCCLGHNDGGVRRG